MSTWKTATCERCEQLCDAKENALGIMGGHLPEQCINLLKEKNAVLQSEQNSLFAELATICNGPGRPRKGETRNAYWLWRIGKLLIYEQEKSRSYATKYFNLIFTEICHDIDNGLVIREDLEPYISQIASLIERA